MKGNLCITSMRVNSSIKKIKSRGGGLDEITAAKPTHPTFEVDCSRVVLQCYRTRITVDLLASRFLKGWTIRLAGRRNLWSSLVTRVLEYGILRGPQCSYQTRCSKKKFQTLTPHNFGLRDRPPCMLMPAPLRQILIHEPRDRERKVSQRLLRFFL